MQLVATLQLSRPSLRLAPRVRAFSSGSAYLGRRIHHGGIQGAPQLPPRPCRRSGAAAAQPVRAAFLGVGAPEAILVGVVALLVFGPKGLAQAAKSVGSTLRAFAPTIREITSVSQELKSTLEQEIGINEIKEELNRPAVPTPRPAATSSTDGTQQQGAALTELADNMAAATAVDPDIERKRAEAAAAAWGGAAPAAPAAAAVAAAAPAATAASAAAPAAATGAQQPAAAAPQAQQPAAAAAAAAGKPRAVEAMSLDELEAELAKRKSAAAAASAGQVPQQLSADD